MRTIKTSVSEKMQNMAMGYLHSGLATYAEVAGIFGFDPRNISRWFNSNKFIGRIDTGEFVLERDIEVDNIVVGNGTLICVDPSKSTATLTLICCESAECEFSSIKDDVDSIAEYDDEVYLPSENSILYVGAIVGDPGELFVKVATKGSITLTSTKPLLVQVEEEQAQEPEEDYSDATWQATKKYISIVTANGEVFNADHRDNDNFQEALQSLVDGDIGKAVRLISTKKSIESYVSGDIRIEGNSLFYKDVELVSGLAERIVKAFKANEDISHLVAFLENVMVNPTRKTVYRLFDFLRANDIEITEDGHFLAWKIVTSDFKDCYTRTIDNSVGTTVKMERFNVEDNDEITCSSGLHVCSKGYLGHYGNSSDIVVRVKVHPKDVVSIPTDYSDAKMRVCEYYVDSIAELTNSY